MEINNIRQTYNAAAYQAGRAKQNAASASFTQQMESAGKRQPRGYKVYMKTDDMLYSGGNGSGLSFYLKYAQDSTDGDPTVVAKGVDENGNEFEQTIHINDINPRHATVVEMHALEAYLSVDKDGGLSSLPKDPSAGNMGLHDRADFIDMFQRQIRDMNTLGQRRLANYYRYSMREYEKFMTQSKSAGKSKEQAAKEAQASTSDSEIITQADGSKTLIITNQVGGMRMVTSIELSKPSPLAKEHGRQDIEDLEATARSPITTEPSGNGGMENEH
ncbi:MAG: hypothetical protein NC231_01190 [Bacillus sp. (in: Bacteria)]|nr:hypothetical protein [Bacillus sp. (in: firmicutes)]